MNSYTKVYHMLSWDERLIRLANGEFVLPLDSMTAPFHTYGFPPALVPLWSDNIGPRYAGMWKHWFVPRHATFVECYVDEAFRAVEVARSSNQLLDWLLFYSLYIDEEGEQEFRMFASTAGVADFQAIKLIMETQGYDPSHLCSLPAFRQDPPLRSCPNPADYRGDFPHDGMPQDRELLHRVCSLELSAKLQQAISKSPNAPMWISSKNQKDLFEELLQSGDLAGAWMSLNSSGWTFSEVKVAMRRLAEQANDASFSVLAEAWLSLPHETRGGY